jgi:hypothetical protein
VSLPASDANGWRVMPRFRRYKGRVARITARLPSRTIQSRIPRTPITAGCPALVCFRWVKALSSRSRCPGLERPGAQLDRICEDGDVASPLGQGQGSADLERQAVRERDELAPEHPDRQRRMIGKRGVKLSDSESRRFQPHITVGGPITPARPLFLVDQGADQGVRRVRLSRPTSYNSPLP